MESLPSYNPEFTRKLYDKYSESKDEVIAVTPASYAAFADINGDAFQGANKQFMQVFRDLGKFGLGRATVVDRAYREGNMANHVGIRLAYFPEVAAAVNTNKRKVGWKTEKNFHDLNEALFMLPEKRRLLGLLSLARERLESSTLE